MSEKFMSQVVIKPLKRPEIVDKQSGDKLAIARRPRCKLPKINLARPNTPGKLTRISTAKSLDPFTVCHGLHLQSFLTSVANSLRVEVSL